MWALFPTFTPRSTPVCGAYACAPPQRTAAGSRTVFISYHKRTEAGGRVASFSLARGTVLDKCALAASSSQADHPDAARPLKPPRSAAPLGSCFSRLSRRFRSDLVCEGAFWGNLTCPRRCRLSVQTDHACT